MAVIGQSNSILQNGFVAHLKQRPEIEIGHMGRIGASPSVLLPFYAAPEWLAGHDVCILDVAIMDHIFLGAEAIDPASIAQYLGYAIQMIHAAGCLPLLLVIPRKSSLPCIAGGAKVPFLHQIYRGVAARHDAMLLDLIDGLDDLGRRSPAALDAAYGDPNHPAESMQRAIADRIVALIGEAMSTPIERRRVSVAIPNFERLSLAGLCPEAPGILQMTSLYRARFTVISPGDRLALATGHFDRLHALLVNRSRSGARLAIEGDRTVVKIVGTKNEREHALVVQLCSVVTPVRDRDGMLVLSIADRSVAVTEESCDPFEEEGGHIELGEILIERGWSAWDFARPSLPWSLARPYWRP
ncbi:hypothetical protein [Sphingomonas sp. MMS24-J13]|uniref:hypothetical protein n=1 Tax=Sphingomonas sp. MMS24-J13 TaxID=3238686 RepID=UPI0038511BAE